MHVLRRHEAQHVELRARFSEMCDAAHDAVVRPFARRRASVGVVDALRTVNADADEPFLFREETRRVGRHERRVCLHGEMHCRASARIAADRVGGRPEEVEPCEKRLAALEGDRERVERQGEVRGDHALKHFCRHDARAVWIQRRLVEVEAVVAGEVAGRACRLHEQGEWRDGRHQRSLSLSVFVISASRAACSGRPARSSRSNGSPTTS